MNVMPRIGTRVKIRERSLRSWRGKRGVEAVVVGRSRTPNPCVRVIWDTSRNPETWSIYWLAEVK